MQYILLDGPIDGKEDCLYLSVFCPRVGNVFEQGHCLKHLYTDRYLYFQRESKEGGLMKVLVYMHGGAFMFGTGSTIRPDYIMDKDDDLVFVAISYRVGPMGDYTAENAYLSHIKKRQVMYLLNSNLFLQVSSALTIQ